MTDTGPQNPLNPADSAPRIGDMRSSTQLSDAQLEELGIIYPAMDEVDLLNAYRDLRNKLLRLADRENFVCLVCALAPDDETSLLSMNLGAVIAFDRARSAIVIDCDVKESLIDRLAQSSEPGHSLVEFIEYDHTDVGGLILESGIPRLRIVASGHPTDTRTETLESPRMREIILELKARYSDRYIFINAPSMRMSSEVQVLSQISDMVLFQLAPGRLTEKELTEAIEMIGADKVAGIVLKED